VAAYLAALAPLYSRSALERRLAAIGHAHRLGGLDWSAGHPAIRSTLRGIYRQHGSRRRQAAALTSVELKKLVAACPGDLAGLRDRALLLLGFAGALRRAELVGLDREHLRFTETGLRLLLPRPKTGGQGGRTRPQPRQAARDLPGAGGRGWRPRPASTARCSARSTAGATSSIPGSAATPCGRSTMIPEPNRAGRFVGRAQAAVGNIGASALRLADWLEHSAPAQ
jgi:hypothetical protein